MRETRGVPDPSRAWHGGYQPKGGNADGSPSYPPPNPVGLISGVYANKWVSDQKRIARLTSALEEAHRTTRGYIWLGFCFGVAGGMLALRCLELLGWAR